MRIRPHIPHFAEKGMVVIAAKAASMPLSSMLLSLIMITSLSTLSLAEDPLLAVQPPNLEGIWTMDLGSEQATMMIRQREAV